jgi:hypothetical protein
VCTTLLHSLSNPSIAGSYDVCLYFYYLPTVTPRRGCTNVRENSNFATDITINIRAFGYTRTRYQDPFKTHPCTAWFNLFSGQAFTNPLISFLEIRSRTAGQQQGVELHGVLSAWCNSIDTVIKRSGSFMFLLYRQPAFLQGRTCLYRQWQGGVNGKFRSYPERMQSLWSLAYINNYDCYKSNEHWCLIGLFQAGLHIWVKLLALSHLSVENTRILGGFIPLR